jgi:tRNA G18 (ribose-2'-O)-methylase SpoU
VTGPEIRTVHLEGGGDPRLADYVDLRDVELRKSLEAEHGLFIAEGEKVIRRAIEAGHEVRSFLLSERWLADLSELVEATNAPCYVLPAAEIERLTGFHVHRGALASLARRPLPSVAKVIAGARSIVVLEDIVDHTNVGAIFRSAAAFGVDAAVLAPRCADPLYRRSIKVSMGAVFTLPYARMANWYDGLAEIRAAGLRVLALTPAPDAVSLEAALAESERRALVFGTEGDGLSSRWLEQADAKVRIPIDPAIDSLNVAAAAAVACYVLAGSRSSPTATPLEPRAVDDRRQSHP